MFFCPTLSSDSIRFSNVVFLLGVTQVHEHSHTRTLSDRLLWLSGVMWRETTWNCCPSTDVCAHVSSSSHPGLSCPLQRRSKPVYPPKPSALSQQSKSPVGLRLSTSSLSPGSSSSSLSVSSFSSSSSNSSFRNQLQRRSPVLPGTVKLPHGVRTSSQEQGLSSSFQASRSSRQLLKMRERPSRRKDGTQSLYVDGADCPTFLPSSSTMIPAPQPSHQRTHDSVTQGQRRFSDPALSCMDSSDAWRGRKGVGGVVIERMVVVPPHDLETSATAIHGENPREVKKTRNYSRENTIGDNRITSSVIWPTANSTGERQNGLLELRLPW